MTDRAGSRSFRCFMVRWLSLLGLATFLTPGICPAQATGFTPEETLGTLVQLEMRVVPETARPGENARVVTTAHVKRGWHIYSLLPQGQFGPSPTGLTLRAPGYEPVGPVYETNPTHQRDTAFDLDLWFHPVAARFYQNLIVRRDAAPGRRTVEEQVKYQTCNDRFCTPPRTETLTGQVAIESGPVRPEFAAMLRTVDYLDSSGQFREDANTLDSVMAGGLWGFLALAAGFGLLALLTPCVFPMIPVTVTFFAGQARDKGGVGLALLFGLGLVVSYTGLGLGMTFLLGASGVGRFATSPWVNLLVAGFFVLFALALLGWIRPALPAGLVQRLDRSVSRVHGPAGVILMGVAFTAANFTCTMPFVGTLLLAASQGQVLWPFVGMVVFSGVFALPFVALALFPRWLWAFRGRGGHWLVRLKTVLALVEIGAALKFVSNADVIMGWGIVNREMLLGLWAVISVGCGLVLLYGVGPVASEQKSGMAERGLAWLRALLFPRPRGFAWRKMLWIGPGLAFLALALYLSRGVAGGELDSLTESYVPPRVRAASIRPAEDDRVARLPWHGSIGQALALSARSGKPIFIDFTGYTCVNCRWMEKRVFAQGPVLNALLTDFVLVRLYTDGGSDGEKNQRLQVERFRTLALPYYVILAPDDAVLAIHAGILPSVSGFLDFLAQGSRHTAGSPAGPGLAAPGAGTRRATPPSTSLR